jgi:hypothetical protein
LELPINSLSFSSRVYKKQTRLFLYLLTIFFL